MLKIFCIFIRMLFVTTSEESITKNMKNQNFLGLASAIDSFFIIILMLFSRHTHTHTHTQHKRNFIMSYY